MNVILMEVINMKTLTINNRTFQYEIFEDSTEWGTYYYTEFYDGTTINLRATTVNTLFGSNTQLQATLTVEGRDSGARLTIPITVKKIS